MATIKENLDRIKNAKSAIKNAIIQKGIEVTDTERIETYADKILQIKSGGGEEIPEFDPNGPLTIYCFDDWGDAYVKFSNNFTNGKVYYSKDKETWTQYKGEILKLTKGEFVQFKGSIITTGSNEKHFTIKNGLFNLYGNLTSLDSYNTVLSESVFYRSMFSNTNLYDCSNLNFGIEYIQNSAGNFESMFKNCIYMIHCPKILLPTALISLCYQSMFKGCLSLIKAPELPATTLADSCYESMFDGCISLTTVPNLPATTLADSCYKYMFSGCTGLNTIPSNLLPATTLADSCYKYMFYGCSSLTTVPSNLLPATTLGRYCYDSMFSGCTSLTTVSNLPATKLRAYCYQYMFYGCSSLTTVPSNLLPATTLIGSCYKYMFSGCTSLTTVPNLHATTLSENCYQYMFNGCTGLVETPAGWYLPAQTTATNSCSNMFAYCSKLQKMAVSYSGAITSSHWRNFLYNVSKTGKFYYSKNQTKENIQSIVPSGWTLVQSSEW